MNDDAFDSDFCEYKVNFQSNSQVKAQLLIKADIDLLRIGTASNIVLFIEDS
jgi:hypothetical protein